MFFKTGDFVGEIYVGPYNEDEMMNFVNENMGRGTSHIRVINGNILLQDSLHF